VDMVAFACDWSTPMEVCEQGEALGDFIDVVVWVRGGAEADGCE
jgi:hypothetical protein